MTDPVSSIDVPPLDDDKHAGLLRVAALAIVGGVLIGVVGGLFRLLLREAERLRVEAVAWAEPDLAVRGALLVVLAAVMVGLARYVVRLVPESGGSGVQRGLR